MAAARRIGRVYVHPVAVHPVIVRLLLLYRHWVLPSSGSCHGQAIQFWHHHACLGGIRRSFTGTVHLHGHVQAIYSPNTPWSYSPI